ncbi:hypothetical protein ACFL0V_04210 [Nanoarchaeota archaeon]
MNRRLFIGIFVAFILLSALLSGCAGTSRISGFFENEEYKQHTKLIDFLVFFVLFFAACFLGFSKWFGEGFGKPGGSKGPVIGLSVALALALSFTLIMSTKFSIATIFPLAKAFLFLIFCLLLYGLLATLMDPKTTTGKIVIFIMAVILIYLLMSMFTHFVCQLSDNMDDSACKSDFFNAFGKLGQRHLWGPGTLFGGSSGIGGGGSVSGGGGGIGGGTTPISPIGGGGGATPDKDDTTLAKDTPTNWTRITIIGILILLLLLGILYYWFLRGRGLRPRDLARHNQRIRELLERLRALIQSRATILDQIPTGAAYPIARRNADYQALTDLLNSIRPRPGIRRPRRPDRNVIQNWFNEHDGAGNPRYFAPLDGELRRQVIDILNEEKDVEYQLFSQLHWYSRLFKNRVTDINGQERRMQDMIFSPKFHANGTVELMFDARSIGNFDPAHTPQVMFFPNTPAGLNNPHDMRLHSNKVYHLVFGAPTNEREYHYIFWLNTDPAGFPGNTTHDIMNPIQNPANNRSILRHQQRTDVN